jgi:ERF superfamily
MAAVSPTTDAQLSLIEALRELQNPTKDEAGQYGRYTSLPALLDHVKPVLARHGYGLVQHLRTELVDGVALVGITTQLLHESGEAWDAGTLLLPAGPTAQTAGSAITYGRRYTIQALLGIAGDDNDPDVATAAQPGVGGHRAAAEQSPPAGAGEVSGGHDTPAPAPSDDYGPTLPLGGGPPDWKAIAQRLTREWKQNVTQTDAQQAVIGQLRREDIPVKKPSDLNEDLAHHALMELIKKRPAQPAEGGKA